MKMTKSQHVMANRIVNTKKKKRAFTFLEILIAAMLLSIAVVGVLATFLSVRGMINRSQKRLISLNVATYTLSRLSKDVNAVSGVVGTDRLAVGNTDSGTQTLHYPSYTFDWDYTVSAAPGGYNYKIVEFTVEYPEDQGN